MRKLLPYALAVSAITTNLFAQQIAETIEVRVTNVDVVVTGRDGKPMRGLTRDDFELYENKKLQPITNFYEITGETVPEPAAMTATASAAGDGRRSTETAAAPA